MQRSTRGKQPPCRLIGSVRPWQAPNINDPEPQKSFHENRSLVSELTDCLQKGLEWKQTKNNPEHPLNQFLVNNNESRPKGWLKVALFGQHSKLSLDSEKRAVATIQLALHGGKSNNQILSDAFGRSERSIQGNRKNNVALLASGFLLSKNYFQHGAQENDNESAKSEPLLAYELDNGAKEDESSAPKSACASTTVTEEERSGNSNAANVSMPVDKTHSTNTRNDNMEESAGDNAADLDKALARIHAEIQETRHISKDLENLAHVILNNLVDKKTGIAVVEHSGQKQVYARIPMPRKKASDMVSGKDRRFPQALTHKIPLVRAILAIVSGEDSEDSTEEQELFLHALAASYNMTLISDDKKSSCGI